MCDDIYTDEVNKHKNGQSSLIFYLPRIVCSAYGPQFSGPVFLQSQSEGQGVGAKVNCVSLQNNNNEQKK